ncbi:MAG: T9SS type A sorting domain-containing protein, partial [Bacteroidales bacterium]
MKRYIFILITSLIVLNASVQAQQVIASAGGYYTNTPANLTLSWTLGETIIPSYPVNNGLQLTTGFQSVLRSVIVEENIDNPVKVTVFPNPAGDYLNISFADPLDAEVNMMVIDTQGRLFKTQKIEAATSEIQLNFQDLPSGVYLVKLTKGKLTNVYKVVKL